jgi:hypothetical protein
MTTLTYTTAEAKFVHACKQGDLIEATLYYGLNEISHKALDAALHMAVKYDHPELAHWVYSTIHAMDFLAMPVPDAPTSPLNFPITRE